MNCSRNTLKLFDASPSQELSKQHTDIKNVTEPTDEKVSASSAQEKSPLTAVVNLDPNVVFLEYNCYYMRAICQNAYAYLMSAVGSGAKDRTTFHYDFNGKRKGGRRKQMCPSSWKKTHACPEVAVPGNPAQPAVMPGPWPHTQLQAPGTLSYIIAQKLDAQGNVVPSKRRYTCDEFPPATWVQGGAGFGATSEKGYTRCAPQLYCAGGATSEQDWQGDSHNKLRVQLENMAQEKLGRILSDMEVVEFQFRMTNNPLLPPARILTVSPKVIRRKG